MTLLEAEAHSSLLRFLRSQSVSVWPHHLTMARIVARTLRLERSAILQTSSTIANYSLSYLTPALLSSRAVILVAPLGLQKRLLQGEIPQLQANLSTHKQVLAGDYYPRDGNFQGLFLTSPQAWLRDRLENQGNFPQGIPTLIDQADNLGEWAAEILTQVITPQNWLTLSQHNSEKRDFIQSIQAKLTKLLFSHPQNPYECFLLDDLEKACLQELFDVFPLWTTWQTRDKILWAAMNREKGQFTLNLTPADVAPSLQAIWKQQSVVFIGGFLDSEKAALTYTKQLGIGGDLLCLKFSNSRSHNLIDLYIPPRLPMPNTAEFQGVILQEICQLVKVFWNQGRSIVILVEDVPLKPQIASVLAAKFGSVVQVEKAILGQNIILVCSWQFWHDHQDLGINPHLLIMSTLPIPSPENPLVAGRIAYYKQKRQDWFHRYLLPTALKDIERAIAPLRETQGMVALLDNRVNFRSYGTQILSLLEPYARINYLDKNPLLYGRI